MSRLVSLYQRSSPYIEAVLNFIYLPACIVCESLPEPEKKLICETCWQKLPRLKPSDELAAHPIEMGENEINPLLALGVWEFNDDMQTVIHEMSFPATAITPRELMPVYFLFSLISCKIIC